MTPHEIHALSGAYAVDALDDLERERFERHLADCAECRAEVDSLRAAAGMLAETTPAAPPPELRERLMEEIRTVRPLPPLTSSGSPRRRRWIGLGMVAAVLAIALGGAGIVAWQQSQSQAPVSATDRVLNAGDAERYTVTLDGATATLVRSPSQHRAVLVTEDMPPAPAGKVYQLWLQDDADTMVPAGLMPAGENQTVLLDGDAARAIGAGITVEPAGGSPEPTSGPIALFEFTGPA